MFASTGIAIDRLTGEVYVADCGTRSPLAFALDANSNAAPSAPSATVRYNVPLQ